MALPTSYLTSVKNLEAFLNAIRSAKAPDKFTISFLESLEFKSSSDRLLIGVLKLLGFIDDNSRPTERYFKYLDQSQSGKVLAEGMQEAYEDLFRVNVNAYTMSRAEIINKFKTLSQGKISDSVLDKMALTFTGLVKFADFSRTEESTGDKTKEISDVPIKKEEGIEKTSVGLKLGGLVYNIQIVLPESRDTAVYDALFQSLRKHLL